MANKECLERYSSFCAISMLDAQARLAFVEEIIFIRLALTVAAIAGLFIHAIGIGVCRCRSDGSWRVKFPQTNTGIVAAGGQEESAIVVVAGVVVVFSLLTIPKSKAGDPIKMSW